MEEGTIIRWLASEGASIERGQELVEIETDKASMTYEADQSGTLHILAKEGDTLPVGASIAELLAPGEHPQSSSAAPAPPHEHELAYTPPASESAQSPSAAGDPRTDPGSAGETSTAPTPPARGERVKASPLARRLASTHGVDISALSGSGPGGRIVRADVERATQAAMQTGVQAPSQSKGQTQIIELSRTQSLVARRMAEAKATIPEFTLQRVIDMECAVQLREQLKALDTLDGQTVPSFNDMVLKACALALREHPRANATYKDGRFELHTRVNIGVAVAVNDALLVPVIHDADERSIWEIAAQARALASSAREGTITPPQLAGATFSVSNLGMYGIDSFTAIIAPGQAAILAVGALAPRAAAVEGELTIRHTMTLTLTCDHRILYGAEAAQLLDLVRARLEQPLSLLR
jgi:pyruvate dehydrogenase E2 component (dihydrolipoamide acetyltransferase)